MWRSFSRNIPCRSKTGPRTEKSVRGLLRAEHRTQGKGSALAGTGPPPLCRACAGPPKLRRNTPKAVCFLFSSRDPSTFCCGWGGTSSMQAPDPSLPPVAKALSLRCISSPPRSPLRWACAGTPKLRRNTPKTVCFLFSSRNPSTFCCGWDGAAF